MEEKKSNVDIENRFGNFAPLGMGTVFVIGLVIVQSILEMTDTYTPGREMWLLIVFSRMCVTGLLVSVAAYAIYSIKRNSFYPVNVTENINEILIIPALATAIALGFSVISPPKVISKFESNTFRFVATLFFIYSIYALFSIFKEEIKQIKPDELLNKKDPDDPLGLFKK